MNYKDAFAIGSRCDGYIKCHYAELFSVASGKLFSLQDANFSNKNQAAAEYNGQRVWNTEKDKPSGEDILIYDRNTYSGNINNLIANIYYDIPVVEAVSFVDYDTTIQKSKRVVPVRLTKIARQHIAQKLAEKTRPLYTVYMINANDETERHEVLKTYDSKKAYGFKDNNYFRYEVTVDPASVLPKYKELIDIINSNGIFYVRPVALDWIPTDIANMQITKDLAAAKRKLDAAKAILATAGAATILL